MRISESEKNRIKSMYGLINEDAPPSESVLVANKNPFKYPEYKSARKPYNNSLKDGDLFYIVTLTDEYDRYNMESKLMDNFFSTVKNKSLRYYLSDFSDNKDYSNMVGNLFEKGEDEYSNMVCVIKSLRNYELSNNAHYRVNMECKTDNGDDINFDDIMVLIKDDGLYFDVIKGFGSSYISFKGVNELFIKNVKKELQDIIDRTKVENLPDDLFQIRKIQREKTDF